MSATAILGKLAGDAAGGLLGGIGSLLNSVRGLITGKEALKSEDITKVQEFLNQIETKLIELQSQIVEAQKSIITAEAQGESSLQRNWRPITMITFLVIIVYQGMFVSIFGLPPVDFSSIPDKMWDLLSVGIGGYVVMRSVEKSVKSYSEGSKK